jgi:hypothetical protein
VAVTVTASFPVIFASVMETGRSAAKTPPGRQKRSQHSARAGSRPKSQDLLLFTTSLIVSSSHKFMADMSVFQLI